MDVVFNVFLIAVNWVVSALGTLFDLIFFWLPDDFISPLISDLEFVVRSNVTAIKWLNWFVDVPFFVAVFGLAVSALLVWTAFRIFDYLFKKATGAITFFKP